MTTLQLGTIAAEREACLAAFAAHPEAKSAWHVHHDMLVEKLDDAPEARVSYIVATKPEAEQALRLRLFRPVLDNQAVAEPRRVYEQALVEPWRVRDQAEAEAWRVYNQAVAEPRRVYEQALAALHARECPACPWDGQSILGEAWMENST